MQSAIFINLIWPLLVGFAQISTHMGVTYLTVENASLREFRSMEDPRSSHAQAMRWKTTT
jgi:hypothetical protein